MEDFGYTVKGEEDQQTKKRQKRTLMLLICRFYGWKFQEILIISMKKVRQEWLNFKFQDDREHLCRVEQVEHWRDPFIFHEHKFIVESVCIAIG